MPAGVSKFLTNSDLPARAFNVDCEGPNSFTKLARYETSIERSIDRCLRQLKTYQAARAASTPRWGRGVPPPRHDPPPPPPPRGGRGVPACQTRPPGSGAGGPACRGRNARRNTPGINELPFEPKKWGIAQFSAAAMALMVYALLHAVPQLIAALTLLLPGPRTAHNRPKMNILHLYPGGIACLVGHTPGLRPGLRGSPGPAPGDWPIPRVRRSEPRRHTETQAASVARVSAASGSFEDFTAGGVAADEIGRAHV